MALTGLFNFTVAIVISAGLDNTCDAFEDSTGKSIPYVLSIQHKMWKEGKRFRIQECL